MYCKYCGAPITRIDRKCTYCGSDNQEYSPLNKKYAVSITIPTYEKTVPLSKEVMDAGISKLVQFLAHHIDYQIIDYPVSYETKIIFYID